MRIAMNSVVRWMIYATVAVVLGSLFVSPIRAAAQTAGNKAVYNSSGVTASSAYIDASGVTQGSDICVTLANVLAGSLFNTGSGAVIDARGINPGTTQPCSVNPWGVIPSGGWAKTATILLPSGTITISKTWILPNFSRVFGEGPGVTKLAAAAAFSPDVDGVNAMMELGSAYTSSSCGSAYCFCGGGTTKPADCVSVGIRDLTLDASNYTGSSQIVGVENEASQELSFVDHVSFNNAPTGAQSNGMLGLNVFTNTSTALISSNNSGPYSNLIFTAGGNAGAGTQCAAITGVAGTRGIHGLSCNSAVSSLLPAAITLDGNSTSIEDVFINGFADGILVGSKGPAEANVLSNIIGGSTVTDLVHIDNITSSSSSCPGPSGGAENVCDLSILQATSAAGTTISDQITGATLSNSTDPYVGMYVLGEQLGTSAASGQYSRFTTSPKYPTWGVGNSSPASSSSCNATSANGSLYSNTSATSTTGTLFVCVSGSWVKAK
jgi:hypothetical protein